MKQFCHEDFLLENATAKELYRYAQAMPILDYHNHLSAKELYENIQFKNLTELWLKTDHYKWRQMRTCGVKEEYITGKANDWDKFLKWVECCEMLIGNPLTHWCQLELKFYFNIEKPLIVAHAKEIWEETQTQLAHMTCRTFLAKAKVYAICTTDDPIDDLSYHSKLQTAWPQVKVIGNFRPDKILNINADGFLEYINTLSTISNINITNYQSLIKALHERIKFYHEKGCRSADHGLNQFKFIPATIEEGNAIIEKRLQNKQLTEEELFKFISLLLLDLSRFYYQYNWAMLWHLNCSRNNNPYLFKKLGVDIGCDSIREEWLAQSLNQILGQLSSEKHLGKLSIFSLNPNNWDAIASLVGNFQNNEQNIKGKIQFGTAWWFGDTYAGNISQIKKFAEYSALGTNIGMLTDSRAYSSFVRHDYYRRLLCNVIGEWVEQGMCINDKAILKKLIENICFNNAKTYFGY